MNKPAVELAGIVLLLTVAAIWFFGGFGTPDPDTESRGNRNLAAFLSAEPNGDFAEVTKGYPLQFPRDHGAHPAFRQEWWYFTGNLRDEDGRQYGYQLTFFRFATPGSDQLPEGPWNSGQTWMSHFAVTDVDGNQFIASQDFARGGPGLADATAAPFAVWVNGWSARQGDVSCDRCFAVQLRADNDQQSINLLLESDQAPLLHGDQGYSVKSNDSLVASYYYAYPDLRTSGSIQVGDKTVEVTGRSWMDREWSSAVLAKGQRGWDWFALHLDDGSKLMVFQVRGDGKEEDDYRYGVLHHPDNRDKDRVLEEITLTPSQVWKSPVTDGQYPLEWRLQSEAIDLLVSSAVQDQEMDFLFAYYEGVVNVEGKVDGNPTTGVGYMEMTGYGKK